MIGCDGDDDPAPIRNPERGQTATKECVVKRKSETRRDLMPNDGWKCPASTTHNGGVTAMMKMQEEMTAW